MKLLKIIPFLSILLASQIQNDQVVLESGKILQVLSECPPMKLNANSNIIISMPSLKGSIKKFRMFYSPVMPPSLIKKYPEIRTYTGIGLENPNEWASVTVGKDKIKVMILGSDGTVFIDPVEDGMDLYRISKTEMGAPVSRDCSQCENDDSIKREDGANSRTTRNFPSCVGETEPCYSIGDTLVTFRFAGILTAEANNEVGGGQCFWRSYLDECHGESNKSPLG